VHPIERLRYVARATGAEPDDVVREAAGSLAGFADDPAALVTACRRLIERHPANGPIWWLCARTLVAADPADEVWRAATELHGDPTAGELAHALRPDASVVIVGWSERLLESFGPRGDLQVRVVDVDGDGPGFVRALERIDVEAHDVPAGGLAAAVATADVMVLTAEAIGPSHALCSAGSWPAAAVARHAEVPVWLVGGVGRVLPEGLWRALVARLEAGARSPWTLGHDQVPLDLVDQVVTGVGLRRAEVAAASVDCPDAPELRR
jgi:hypothetical protein